MENSIKHSSVRRSRESGFTLIELVMVIVITGILAGVVAPMIARPTSAFLAETRRGALVDTAETALDRMSREVRLAVPNSVRVDGTSHVVEFLRTIDGGRYRSASPPGIYLDFASTTGFDVIGDLAACDSLNTSNIAATCAKESACYVVVGNLGGGTGSDAFAGDNTEPLQSCSKDGAADGSDHIDLAAAKSFPQPSPNQRFQIIDTPVTYLCDLTAGTLRRYDGYTITASQSNVDTDTELTSLANPAESYLMAKDVSACQFSYDASITHLLTVSLTITRDNESISLSKKIRVENQP